MNLILAVIGGATILVIIIYQLRRYITRKVEYMVTQRVEEALKIKEIANRVSGGFGLVSVNGGDFNKIKPVKHNSVTVLFADIQGFTKIVEHLNPDVLIDELDHFFFRFDSIVDNHDIQKIKTIGDAYMAAGGLLGKSSTHPVDMMLVALEIQGYMEQLRTRKLVEHEDFWELRIGIHTGPVISGKIGRKNIHTDIWGDTVNIASRMESSGVAGEINISGTTYQLVRDFFTCEYRGKMPVKYKGEIEMYFVKGIAPELSEPGRKDVPNTLFNIRLQHLRFADLEEAVLRRMEQELQADMYYHNVKHTIDVITQAEIIGRGEGIDEEELLVVKTAALLHDAGFILSYDNHEEFSVAIATEILKHYKYVPAQIDQVVNLIEVTRHKEIPTTKLQAILKDADLDYLGRSDFMNLSDNLFKELATRNKKMNLQEWNRKQLDFLTGHKYYTRTAQVMRQSNKESHARNLKGLLVTL